MSDRATTASVPMRSFNESLPMALLTAREAAMRLFRPTLADHGLTEQQWRVLRALTAESEPIEVGPLAERTSLLAPSLSRILVNLEDRSLIDREVAPHDQRRAVISLTSAGNALVESVAPESEARYAEIEKRFGTQRLRSLIDELHELSAELSPTTEDAQ